jgi:hypothetical protein
VLIGNELSNAPTTGLRVASLSMLIGGLVLSIVGGAISGSATPHLWNAINMYNDGVPAPYPAYPGYYPAYPSYPTYPAYPGYPAASPQPGVAPSSYAPAPQPPPAAPR